MSSVYGHIKVAILYSLAHVGSDFVRKLGLNLAFIATELFLTGKGIFEIGLLLPVI